MARTRTEVISKQSRQGTTASSDFRVSSSASEIEVLATIDSVDYLNPNLEFNVEILKDNVSIGGFGFKCGAYIDKFERINPEPGARFSAVGFRSRNLKINLISSMSVNTGIAIDIID